MSILFSNVAIVFGSVLAFSVFGWFIIAPFLGSRPFIALAAPWAGMAMMVFFSLFFYVMLKLPYAYASAVAAAACIVLTLIMFFISGRPLPSWRNLVTFLLAVFALSAIETVINTYMSYRLGGPAILYTDGTDHAGWAWTADWLRIYPITHRPLDWMSANLDTYQWIPYFHFSLDPRFGTFAVLALMSTISGLSGFFAYDLACGLGLTVGILAMIGIFCHTRSFALLLALGLVTCHWFDYGKTGYLGKLVDYPSVFAVAGLAFLAFRVSFRERNFAMVSMALLIIAVSHLYAGPVLGLFLGLLGLCFIASNYLFASSALDRAGRRVLFVTSRDQLMFLSLGVVLAIVASGIIARPLALTYSNYDLTWAYVLARDADLEHQGAHLSPFTDAQLVSLTWLMGGIWLVGLAAAFMRRSADAVALIGGPMLLLFALYAAHAQAMAFQLIGTFYPLALAGLIVIAEQAAFKRDRVRLGVSSLVAALSLVAICLHIPRFLGALDRFEGPATPSKYQFTKAEMDGLAKNIGSVPTMIDVVEAPQFGLALVVGLGPDVPLQWSERAWQYFSGCKPGVDSCATRPPEPRPPGFRIVSAQDNVEPSRITYRTRQFLLIKESQLAN
jgi:hypothetical protein